MGLAGEGSGLTTVPPQAVPGDSTPVEKPLPFNYSCQTLTGAVHPVFGVVASRRLPPGRAKTVTWLILPVVICLSQRLSHACLSISNYTVKLRMAH